uniref:Uncharacterized protein n=1 Tax=Anguilla anguilla TaxID=7936 RepID=A0A0E9WGQ3_ANGAN
MPCDARCIFARLKQNKGGVDGKDSLSQNPTLSNHHEGKWRNLVLLHLKQKEEVPCLPIQ